MDYKSKYLKYKQKYLIQIGGGKIFDLSKTYKYKKGELQKNLKQFEKDYGNNFKLKYNGITIDVELKKIKLPSKLEFYSISYDIPHRTSQLKPLRIDFLDITNSELNNISYIPYIQKTDKFSGTDLVKMCLEINRILGAEKTLLNDSATIICDMNGSELDLSFIKLLEKDKTFYMNLGFDFELVKSNTPYFDFTDKKELDKEIDRLLKNIRNIKTKDIINEYEDTLDLINKIIKENYKEKIEILYDNSFPTIHDETYDGNPDGKISSIFDECKDVLGILYKYKDEKYLYKILIKLFKDNCYEYALLNHYILMNMRTTFQYGKKNIKRNYVIDLHTLRQFRHHYHYSYTF